MSNGLEKQSQPRDEAPREGGKNSNGLLKRFLDWLASGAEKDTGQGGGCVQ